MNKKIATLILGISMQWFLAGNAAAVLITFDDVAAYSTIDTFYAASGVTFGGIENGVAQSVTNSSTNSGIAGVPSTANYLWNSDFTGPGYPSGGDRWDVLQIFFTTTASNVSLYVNSHGSNPVTLNAYDASGALLETIVSGAGINFENGYVQETFTSGGIARIDGVQPSDGWVWSLDNLQFTPGDDAPVPVPATLALFGLGLAGLGWSRRRKA